MITRTTSPEDNLDNVVRNVGVDDKSEAHHKNSIDGLLRVVGCDISITDCANCTDSPIQGVEILQMPV